MGISKKKVTKTAIRNVFYYKYVIVFHRMETCPDVAYFNFWFSTFDISLSMDT